MARKRLVHKTEYKYEGIPYEIMVYCDGEGHHFAETYLNDDDIIINDGPSLEEVLNKHTSILPLAIASHKIRKFVYKTSSPYS